MSHQKTGLAYGKREVGLGLRVGLPYVVAIIEWDGEGMDGVALGIQVGGGAAVLAEHLSSKYFAFTLGLGLLAIESGIWRLSSTSSSSTLESLSWSCSSALGSEFSLVFLRRYFHF